MSALHLLPNAPPPLTDAMREHLLRGLRATIRRDEQSAHYLRLAKQPIGALLTCIAQNQATIIELGGL